MQGKGTQLSLQCEYFPSTVTKETSRRDLAELPQSNALPCCSVLYLHTNNSGLYKLKFTNTSPAVFSGTFTFSLSGTSGSQIQIIQRTTPGYYQDQTHSYFLAIECTFSLCQLVSKIALISSNVLESRDSYLSEFLIFKKFTFFSYCLFFVFCATLICDLQRDIQSSLAILISTPVSSAVQ